LFLLPLIGLWSYLLAFVRWVLENIAGNVVVSKIDEWWAQVPEAPKVLAALAELSARYPVGTVVVLAALIVAITALWALFDQLRFTRSSGRFDIVASCSSAAYDSQTRYLSFPLSITNRSKSDAVVLSFSLTGDDESGSVPWQFGVKQEHERDSREIHPVRVDADKTAFLQMKGFTARIDAHKCRRFVLTVRDQLSGQGTSFRIPGEYDSRTSHDSTPELPRPVVHQPDPPVPMVQHYGGIDATLVVRNGGQPARFTGEGQLLVGSKMTFNRQGPYRVSWKTSTGWSDGVQIGSGDFATIQLMHASYGTDDRSVHVAVLGDGGGVEAWEFNAEPFIGTSRFKNVRTLLLRVTLRAEPPMRVEWTRDYHISWDGKKREFRVQLKQ
jgi:hypothetical protein